MGKQPKKTRSSLPSDLTSEILLRLPAKSVGRFRCVSKLWLSITTDPCFIKSFGTTRPSLLIYSLRRYDLFVTSNPQHTHQSSTRSYSSSQPIRRYLMNLPGEDCYFSRMDSVHGLICIKDADSKKPLVWNPTTDQLLRLPKPNMSSRYANVFLGYDPVEGKHKVVCLPYKKTCYVCRVFTLGSGQESWRTVRTNLKHRCNGYATGQCIKGVIYYIARKFETVIMSFDVRSEIFRMIEPPSGINREVLISYKGRLACINRDKDTRLWILEDADKHKWSFQDFLLPLDKWMLTATAPYEEYSYNRYELKGCTHAGEFIYVPCRFHKFSYAVFYDPVRNSCRRLKFEGVADGLDMHDYLDMRAYPNHIESLMPL